MTAFVPTLLSLALLLTLASPLPGDSDLPDHQPKRIYVGNLPFSTASADAKVMVRVEEGEPAPTQISFAASGRLGTPIQLSAHETMYAGTGRVPAGRDVQSFRIQTGAGMLTVRFPPPADNGWEEGVAAARVRYAPTGGEPVTGQATVAMEVEDDKLGFTVTLTQARIMDDAGGGR